MAHLIYSVTLALSASFGTFLKTDSFLHAAMAYIVAGFLYFCGVILMAAVKTLSEGNLTSSESRQALDRWNGASRPTSRNPSMFPFY